MSDYSTLLLEKVARVREHAHRSRSFQFRCRFLDVTNLETYTRCKWRAQKHAACTFFFTLGNSVAAKGCGMVNILH